MMLKGLVSEPRIDAAFSWVLFNSFSWFNVVSFLFYDEIPPSYLANFCVSFTLIGKGWKVNIVYVDMYLLT